MEVNVPNDTEHWMFIEGIDKVIQLDLGKHKELLAQEQVNLISFRQAVAHSIAHKKSYRKLIGGPKYSDDALRSSIDQINLNTRQLSDKVKLTQDAIEHHTEIVDSLTAQLAQYEVARNAVANRLVQ